MFYKVFLNRNRNSPTLTHFVYYFSKDKTRVLFMLQVITIITLLLHAKMSELTLPFLNLPLPFLCSFIKQNKEKTFMQKKQESGTKQKTLGALLDQIEKKKPLFISHTVRCFSSIFSILFVLFWYNIFVCVWFVMILVHYFRNKK